MMGTFKNILENIEYLLGIPWYDNYIEIKWGLFLSLGVVRYQINTLWIDFIDIIKPFVQILLTRVFDK